MKESSYVEFAKVMALVYSKHEIMELKVSRAVNKAEAEHWPWSSGKHTLDQSGSC